MAEKSIFWTTGSTGDGASAYTQAEVIRWMRQMMVGNTADEGVHKGYLNALAVTGTSSPVQVDTGAAIVYGFPYWCTSAESVAVATPAGNTRIDRIVLRADWSAQTVRITRIAGVEGAGSAPALTQVDSTIWDIPLAQASITTGGVITVTDGRVFLHPNIEVETAGLGDAAVTAAKLAAAVAGNGLTGGAGSPLAVSVDDSTIEISSDALRVKDAGITAAKIANRTRTLYVPASGGYNTTGGAKIGSDGVVVELPDAVASWAGGTLYVPADYVSGMTVEAVCYAATGGYNVYCRNYAQIGAEGETMNNHTNATAYSAVAFATNYVHVFAQELSLTNANAGDVVMLFFMRDATNGADTLAAGLFCCGFIVQYTADS